MPARGDCLRSPYGILTAAPYVVAAPCVVPKCAPDSGA